MIDRVIGSVIGPLRLWRTKVLRKQNRVFVEQTRRPGLYVERRLAIKLQNPVKLICGNPRTASVRQQLINWTTFCCSLISVLYVLINLILGVRDVWAFVAALAYLLIYFFCRLSTNNQEWLGPVLFVLYFVFTAVGWFALAGINGPLIHVIIIPIVTAMGVLQGYIRIFTICGIMLQVVLFTYLQTRFPSWIVSFQSTLLQQLHILLIHYCTTLFCVGFITVLMYNLELRRQQVEVVLRNILPSSVAETLKKRPEHNVAHYFENVSVLFADIVDFTPMSAQMTPVELVSMLNELFSDFDALVELYGVEKIKTIGDCYMVAAGAPLPRHDHAETLAQIALEMQQLAHRKSYKGHRLQLRIGINTGSVVADVIGRNKFIYDLWGDAVNIASRMESQGSSGVIQITQATYEQVSEQFLCVARGPVPIKGKGAVPVWHLLGHVRSG